jgi:NAD+ diphosphatase
MLGFTAEYESGELRIQRSELNKGGWFNLRNLPEIPGKVSLARQLIDYVQINITKTPQSHQGLS